MWPRHCYRTGGRSRDGGGGSGGGASSRSGCSGSSTTLYMSKYVFMSTKQLVRHDHDASESYRHK